jgi:hypothetical protein
VENNQDIGTLGNLHEDYSALIHSGKLHTKSACYLSGLDIDAEQLWVLRFYREHGILPTIRQAKAIRETCDNKKLTLKAFRGIMEPSLRPKKLVFDYTDLSPFFSEGTPPEEMKRDIVKVLTNWKNNINK